MVRIPKTIRIGFGLALCAWLIYSVASNGTGTFGRKYSTKHAALSRYISNVELAHFVKKVCPVLSSTVVGGTSTVNAEELAFAVDMASIEHDVDPLLVFSVIAVESRCDAKARSQAGAQGLMQLMPKTAREYGFSGDLGDHSVDGNVAVGTKYLAYLLSKFSGDVSLGLAAYNAGPANVRKHGGVPPFRETESFVKRVVSLRDSLHKLVIRARARTTTAGEA